MVGIGVLSFAYRELVDGLSRFPRDLRESFALGRFDAVHAGGGLFSSPLRLLVQLLVVGGVVRGSVVVGDVVIVVESEIVPAGGGARCRLKILFQVLMKIWKILWLLAVGSLVSGSIIVVVGAL